jgi:hypothetical protein
MFLRGGGWIIIVISRLLVLCLLELVRLVLGVVIAWICVCVWIPGLLISLLRLLAASVFDFSSLLGRFLFGVILYRRSLLYIRSITLKRIINKPLVLAAFVDASDTTRAAQLRHDRWDS